MADHKRDLDAELAALEAELAAVQSKARAKKGKAAPPEPAPAEPAPPTPAEALEAAAPPPPPAEKKRLALPFGKKEKPAAAPSGAEKKKLALPFGRKKKEAVLEAEVAEAVPEPRAAPAEDALAATPAAEWRQEGTTWVRASRREAPVVRRVLDEEDRVVREEPATRADLDAVSGVRAERGVGRLLRRS